ncbi:centrosomal protein of 131 kDa [Ochotona curzoniae]|uniref:centrosomal protein of 131 kDa n=1 Tax=Ochotona curzoniae TaxID=130825 RepID=UPI001B345A48|nr:centrosomal protein of 131 kDa [Ochotona curzoniae]
MRSSRATPSTPESSPEALDLCLTGLPPPVSRRPGSASTCRSLVRSVSVVSGSRPRSRVLEAAGPADSQAINNLRRSSSATQVGQPWPGSPPRLGEPPDFLALFEGSPDQGKRTAKLSKAASEKGAMWNVLGEEPRGSGWAPSARSENACDPPSDLQGGEQTRALAANFTANNRSSKAAVGNCVTAMVRNRYAPGQRGAAPKSSNQAAPSLNNVVKAATCAGGSFRKAPKNVSSSPAAGDVAPVARSPRRTEVTEEEAERFIHQVNQAAITIQRWYRRQVQRHHAGAASLERLLASKREEQRQQPARESLLDAHRHEAAARRKAREQKARQARQAAIQELQQKRAQKSSNTEPGLPQEPWRAGASGTPRPAIKTNNANGGAGVSSAGPAGPCPAASSQPFEPPRSPADKPQAGPSVANEDLTHSKVQPRTTLDELLDTLRLLEEEPEPLPPPRACHKERYAWMDEDTTSSLTADNLQRLGELDAASSEAADGTLLSEAKLQSILNFLDEMEIGEQERPVRSGEGQEAEAGPRCPELSPEANASVMRLRLEVEEKKQALGLLRRALAQQHDLTARRVREAQKELDRQLRQQREHYEAAAQRHLSFIDQLIEDKKVLSQKCEAVVAELKLGDQRNREQTAHMQEQHELEMKKLKELMSAAEKVRREKWIHEKARRIKEITVRGLEPEVQRLISKHKQELRRLRGLHEAELQQAEERAAQRQLRQVEELRVRLEQEKEELGRQERERARQRFEQQLEQEQLALEQHRRRLQAEVVAEKERLGQQAARQRAELEELRRQLEQSTSESARALRAEFERGQEEQERRHQAELAALKDQLEAERQAWTASCAKKEEAWLRQHERALREELRQERDREIEAVIRRLEADTTQAREEGERAAESRVQRVRDKYEAELQELEQSERKLQGRCAELQGRLGEAEGEALRLRGLLRQREKELQQERAVSERLTAERGNLAQVVRQEFAKQLAASEEENRQVKAELAALQACQRLELDEVHRRVKTALAKKEEAVDSLRRQHEAAVRRADHLEGLLQRQRQPPRAPNEAK